MLKCISIRQHHVDRKRDANDNDVDSMAILMAKASLQGGGGGGGGTKSLDEQIKELEALVHQ